jgi:hypothetical protein
MPLRACPTGEVAASAETVWSFLAEPRRLDLWWDARVQKAEPDGPLAPGQRLYATTRALGHTFRLCFDVKGVDARRRQLCLAVHLPLGIINHATLTAQEIDGRSCRLSFG